MGILSWVIFGLIAGVIAKLVMPGRDPGGCIVTMLIGIAGAFVGGSIYSLFTDRPWSMELMRFDLGSMVLAIIGAVVILAIYRAVLGNRA
jgi:uncharacterized membrane protein YeaQ/YmgE (transglycosylase-associated protein family)